MHLNVHVSWRSVAQILELPNGDQPLPTRSHCPLCRGSRLNVFQDSKSLGCWHHCETCGHSGDLIELCAKTWRLSSHATLDRLARFGSPIPAEAREKSSIDTYIVKQLNYRQRVRRFWARCRQRFGGNWDSEIVGLFNQFRLYTNLRKPLLIDGPGSFIGIADKGHVEALYCPGSAGTGGKKGNHGLGYNPSEYRVFHGKGWKNVLVIPYWDVPGRICAFQFIGRQGGPADRVVRPLRVIAKAAVYEGGLAGLPAVEASNFLCGNAVVAVDDALIMARLQFRHLATSITPLPLVAWQAGPRFVTETAWRALDGRRIVFWALKLTPQLVRQAIMSQGEIALLGPDSEDQSAVDHYLRIHTPRTYLDKVLQHAQPWREALKSWASHQHEGALEDMLVELRLCGVDLARELRDAAPLLRDKAEEVVAAPRARTVFCDGYAFTEYGDGTITMRKRPYASATRLGAETWISDASLHITSIRIGKNEVTYEGYVLHQRERVPFCVPQAQLDQNVLPWLRDVLLRAGRPLPNQTVHYNWPNRVLPVALLLHPPETITETPPA